MTFSQRHPFKVCVWNVDDARFSSLIAACQVAVCRGAMVIDEQTDVRYHNEMCQQLLKEHNAQVEDKPNEFWVSREER